MQYFGLGLATWSSPIRIPPKAPAREKKFSAHNFFVGFYVKPTRRVWLHKKETITQKQNLGSPCTNTTNDHKNNNNNNNNNNHSNNNNKDNQAPTWPWLSSSLQPSPPKSTQVNPSLPSPSNPYPNHLPSNFFPTLPTSFPSPSKANTEYSTVEDKISSAF